MWIASSPTGHRSERQAAAVSRLNPARFGVGSAINQAVRQIGTVLGVTVALIGNGGAHLAAFRTVFGWGAALCVVTAALCLSVDTRPPQRSANA